MIENDIFAHNLSLLVDLLKDEIGLNQKRISKDMMVSNSAFSRWKDGSRAITEGNLTRLVKYLNGKLHLNLTPEILREEKITDIDKYRVDLDDWEDWRKLIEGMNTEQRRKFRDYLISLQ